MRVLMMLAVAMVVAGPVSAGGKVQWCSVSKSGNIKKCRPTLAMCNHNIVGRPGMSCVAVQK